MLNLNEQTLAVYQQKIRAQLKEMKAKMQMFEASAEQAGADMRIEYQKKLDEWKSRLNNIEMQLDKLSDSARDNWDDIQSGIEETMNELHDTLESTTKQFKK